MTIRGSKEDENSSAQFFSLDEEIGEDGLSRIAKAALSGSGTAVQRSNLVDTEATMNATFSANNTLEPSIRPALLVRWYQLSNILQQLADVMTQNVVGAGWRLEPTIKLNTDEGANAVKIAMAIQRANLQSEEKEISLQIDDTEVAARVEELKTEMAMQKAIANRFLWNVNPKKDLIDLLLDMDEDREVVGWGCLEVRRAQGKPKRLDHDKAWTFRAQELGKEIEVKVRTKESVIHWTEEPDFVAYRKYVQSSPVNGEMAWFKEYGDPRIMSVKTGKRYSTVEELKEKEPNANEATELLWFPLSNPESAVYGLVRHSGNINSVVGSNQMEVVNLLYFRDKAIPPLVIMVSGGSLGAKQKEKIKVAIRDHIKGTENFHGVLILEAEPASTGSAMFGQSQQGQVKVEFKPLTDAFFTEQLFGEYDQSNRDKVRQSYRVPKLLIGDTDKIQRATAEAALRYADVQIFGPDRQKIERTFNRLLLDLGVTLWRWVLLPPTLASTLELLEVLPKLVETIMKPDEARDIASKTLGTELDQVDADWVKVPARVLALGMLPKEEIDRVNQDQINEILRLPVDTTHQKTEQIPEE